MNMTRLHSDEELTHGPLIAVSGTLEVEGVSPGRGVDPAGRVELTGHVHLVRGVIAVGAGRSSPLEQVHRVHLGWRSRVMGAKNGT